MFNSKDILETIKMIQEENLDIRTITMGISLLDCIDSDIDRSCEKVYEKMMRVAEHHVETGEIIEKRYGIPIINKRLSVTPISRKGKPRKVCKNSPESSRGYGRKLHRRLFRTCSEGFCGRRP